MSAIDINHHVVWIKECQFLKFVKLDMPWSLIKSTDLLGMPRIAENARNAEFMTFYFFMTLCWGAQRLLTVLLEVIFSLNSLAYNLYIGCFLGLYQVLIFEYFLFDTWFRYCFKNISNCCIFSLLPYKDPRTQVLRPFLPQNL